MRLRAEKKALGKTFRVVDSHTMGEPTRVIYDVFPELHGSTMMERKEYLEAHYDHYRRALMLEPRGHRDMFGALLTEPVSPEADLGVIFMDSGGYLNMCGHGSIGSATVAVETGMVAVTEPYTEVVLEAPVGLIRARVKVERGRAVEVSILNVPSFLYRENLSLELEEYGAVPFDIAFGGSFFALVDSERAGLALRQDNLKQLTDFGMRLREKINRTLHIRHPYLNITTVDLVEIYGPADNPAADRKNVVIFGDAQADRSPCSTGTSAKLATLYAKGELAPGEEFVYESITGSLFRGVITSEIDIQGRKAVIPRITGSAYITGFNEWVLDDRDPLRDGFLLGEQAQQPIRSEREQIIDAAWELFRVKGYHQTSLEDILDRAHVTEEAFLQHFPSRESLLYTLSDLFDRRYSELITEMNPALDPFGKLLLINRELFAMIENRVPVDLLAYLYSEEMVDNGNKALLNRNRLYYRLVESIMAEGLASGEFTAQEPAGKLTEDYALIERGFLYDWCIHRSTDSLTATGNRLMPVFLRGLVFPA